MIITLCGSAKYQYAFQYWNKFLTLKDNVVLSLAVLPSFMGSKNWYDEETKTLLDKVHRDKIDISDAVFVITGSVGDIDKRSQKNAYIGKSTTAEINHAIRNGKKVIYDYEWTK